MRQGRWVERGVCAAPPDARSQAPDFVVKPLENFIYDDPFRDRIRFTTPGVTRILKLI
jgi:hypothetical protein